MSNALEGAQSGNGSGLVVFDVKTGFRSDDDFSTVEEVAENLHMSHETVRVMCRKKTIPAVRIGKRWLIPKGAAADYANALLADQMAG